MVICFLNSSQVNKVFIEKSNIIDKKSRIYSMLFSFIGVCLTNQPIIMLLWPNVYWSFNQLAFPWITGVPVDDDSIENFYRPHFSDLINQEAEYFEKQWIISRFYNANIPDVLINKISKYCTLETLET